MPQPLASGRDDTGSWLVTAALPGLRASGERWRRDPATAVRAIGEGLRALHEALPAAGCPFSWSAQERIADAWRQVAAGTMDRADWHDCHRNLTVAVALDLAVATWSAEWNYGPGWDGLLLDAYGVRPDPERTRYYRLLWDLSS